MAIELNHTIVPARDPEASAGFLAGILGLPVDPPVAHFTPVTLANHVTLDYDQHDKPESHHAFLVSDEEFDAAFDRITERGISFYADPRMASLGHPPATPHLPHKHQASLFTMPNKGSVDPCPHATGLMGPRPHSRPGPSQLVSADRQACRYLVGSGSRTRIGENLSTYRP